MCCSPILLATFLPVFWAALHATELPVIISGGLGNIKHLQDLKKNCNLDAVAVADAIHYNKISVKELKNAIEK